MMRNIRNILLTGIAVLLPLGVTLYILLWMGASAEGVGGQLIQWMLPERFYRPGMGLAVGVLLLFVVGLLARVLIFRRLFEWAENRIGRIPFVKLIYGSMRDLMNFFSGSDKRGFNRVVTVEYDNGRACLVGFVTREDLGGLPHAIKGDDRVAVYLPMSYQIGGFTVFVPRSAVRTVDMSVPEAVRFTMSGGVIAPRVTGQQDV